MLSKIQSIKELVNYQSTRYDLEIEDNHNYYANNILVHNCRCIGHPDGRLISRQLKEFEGLQHIKDDISSLALSFVLDGELFTPDLNFRQIISGIKKEGGNIFSKQIKYYVYDVAIPNMPYHERLQLIMSIPKRDHIIIVPTYVAYNRDHIMQYHDTFKSEGYEGAIVRTHYGMYTPDKRSDELLKVKKFLDREYRIIGANENKGKLVGTCTFTCEALNGKLFDVMPEGTFEERCKYWQDWNNRKIRVGDLLTVEYFEYTDEKNQIPRFPVGKGIRDYE